MSRASPVHTLFRSAGLPAVTLILVGFFAYNAVLGPNGVLAYKEVRQQVDARAAEYQLVEKQRRELKNRVELLGATGGADPDIVDEEVRRQLKLVRPDEIIVPRKPAN